MTKFIKYTISAAREYIQNEAYEADIFIFHVLTNDLMQKNTDVVFCELMNLYANTLNFRRARS